MEKMKRILLRRSLLASVFVVGLITVLIGRSDFYREISDSWKMVYEVYQRVMTHYADQIDPQKLARAGIRGILGELDPYSVYLEKRDRDGLDMLTRGQYGGVGIQLSVRDDSLTVISPMENSPAKRSGILPADRIVAIDGESTTEMNLNEAAKKIRGKKGTTVVLTIHRFGEREDLEFELVRDIIKIKDVSYSGIIEDDVGFIRLSRFSKNSTGEIRKAFESLKEQDVDKLILDLRQNPGGLLESAIRILDMLIEKGEVILYTRGRSEETNRKFISQSEPIMDPSVSLAVLIDHGSASASEIIAGVIQDLDRGVVIGTKSFGKGLVQTVYPLDRERSLKLTTAKYYIPSGRLIQKPDYIDEDIVLSVTDEDSVFTTKNGRQVSANGGISPDIIVEQEKDPILTRECLRRGLFFTFASLYVQDHEMELPVVIDDTILGAFKEYLDSKDVTMNLRGETDFLALEKSLDSAAAKNMRIQHSLDVLRNHFEDSKSNRFEVEKERLALGLEREFSSLLGGIEARIGSFFDDDPAILKAREVLSDQVTYHLTLNPTEF